MASSRFLVGSSMFVSPLSQNPKPRKTQQFHRSNTSFRSQSDSLKSPDDDDEEEIKPIKSHIDFLKLSVTLTVISASLSHSDALAAPAKKKKKRAKKPQELLTAEQLRVWSQGLPVVSDRIPYTEILSLKREGKLKHIIRPPGVDLQAFSEPVLVVLEDSRVFRTVLPSLVGNAKFWESWDELKIEPLCVNAYVPPVKKAELPRSYLGFLRSVKTPSFVAPLMPKKRKKRNKEPEELRKIKEELRLTKEREMEIARIQQEKVERAQKLEKMEEARRRKIQSRIKYEERMREAMVQSKRQSDMWRRLANDSTVSTGLGLVFFYLFYRIVVLGYKKQKKDYEDRLKIQQAEADERKKMKDLELKLQGRAPDSEEAEQGAGEKSAAERQAAKFLKSGARIRKGRNRKLPQYLDTGDGDVTFEDVAGLGKIRIELEEVVKFFTQAEVYRRRGVKIPGGILLCGSPGVGKTLLAKAVAGEAGVNFFSVSASQFVEIYVGVGAARIRALYEEAREHAPSIVFIDELDAVGRARGVIKGSGGRERDATLNQLLVCLDGFEGKGEVITIASTNRPDILDPALVRPGRFDRKILIPIPGRIGRIEILKVHTRNKPMARDVDYEIVAEMTDGMVGAELANVVEVAAASMMREGRTEIRTDDLLQAAQAEERGLLSKKDRTPKMWKQIAINEAAIAVVAANFPDLNNIEFISIAPRDGKELGYVRYKLDSTKFSKGLLSRQCLLDYITIQLAPRAADEIWYGEDQLSTIWAHTADNARSAARAFVLGGLSEKHHGITNFWVADRINAIDLDALKIVNSCHERAKEILQQNRKLMDIVVDQLMEKKNLTRKEFFRLIDLHGAAKPAAPSIVELRNSRRLQFQEMAAANTDQNEEPGTVSSNV